MSKITLEQVEQTLLERKVEPLKIKEILKDLIKAAEEEKADNAENKVPAAKWEHIIVLNDPEGKIKDEVTGWVVVQQTGQDSGLVLSKLADAAKIQNESAKRKKNVIKGYGELFEFLKPKFLKEKNLKIKTKEGVRVLIVNGNTLL